MAHSRRSTAIALSAAALLSAGLLASAPAASAAPNTPSRNWDQFENASTYRLLDALGNGTLKAEEGNHSGGQDFYLRPGRDGYQIESKFYLGRCVTAYDFGHEVKLENCRAENDAQYWDFHRRDDGSPFISLKYPRACITDEGEHNAVVLRPCNDALDQRWYPVEE